MITCSIISQIRYFYFKNLLSLLIVIFFVGSCCSFDKEVALNEFKELKPDAKIVNMIDYECDGPGCECWYVQFKYKLQDTSFVYDTTLQYWKTDSGWITKNEFNKFLK